MDPEAETPVVANRRVALLRPLFARALSLRFVDGPRRSRARRTNAFRDAKNARFGPAPARRRARSPRRRGSAPLVGMRRVHREKVEETTSSARDRCWRRLSPMRAPPTPRPPRGASFRPVRVFPEYKLARSRAGSSALPPGTPGGSGPPRERRPRRFVSGGGETLSRERTSRADPPRRGRLAGGRVRGGGECRARGNAQVGSGTATDPGWARASPSEFGSIRALRIPPVSSPTRRLSSPPRAPRAGGFKNRRR